MGLKPNVTLHIDRLVLDGAGFETVNRETLAAAVEAELGRLFAEGGAGPSLRQEGRTRRLDGGRFQAPPGGGAAGVGRQIARSIYGGLNR